MQIIPALNVKNGKIYVSPDKSKLPRSIHKDLENPLQAARELADQGAEKLHIVDLDGALKGEVCAERVVAEIVKEVPVSVQVAGGIRQLGQIDRYLKIGIDQVVLGTIAVKYPKMIYQIVRNFGSEHIVVSVDVQGGKLKYAGWREQTQIPLNIFLKLMEDQGIQRIIYTDIDRVDTMEGIDYPRIKEIAKFTRVKLTVAGGIKSEDDLQQLVRLTRYNVDSVIVGKAIYATRFNISKQRKEIDNWKKKFD